MTQGAVLERRVHGAIRHDSDDLAERDNWSGPLGTVAFDEETIAARLRDLSRPCHVVRVEGGIGVTGAGQAEPQVWQGRASIPLLASARALLPTALGDRAFRRSHGVRLAYAAGAMANGIASERLVIALGQAGLLGSFGAAGLSPARIESAIAAIQDALPSGPYAFNLIHSPSDEALERAAVELYLRRGVTTVEAAAYLDLTPHLVRYRVAGLARGADGTVIARNRVIAKVSRREVAARFMSPAPAAMLRDLLAQGLIDERQALLAEQIALCDDLTVEADSGGHTDNRALVCQLPAILALRDEMHARHGSAEPVRVGAAGGIATAHAALGAFAMGASYVVAGSVNQATRESGASSHTKELLAQAESTDVIMAPSADMFEMGVKVQLLKRGTMFPIRAQRLFDLYRTYESIEALPSDEREKLERQVFRRGLEEVWADTVTFFRTRDPEQLARAEGQPKRKMALIFRWYLGLSSRWSISGESGREMDYQIWCGPAMGAFNAWVRGSYLQDVNQRGVVDVAHQIMTGAAYLARVQDLARQGVTFSPRLATFMPAPLEHIGRGYDARG